MHVLLYEVAMLTILVMESFSKTENVNTHPSEQSPNS